MNKIEAIAIVQEKLNAMSMLELGSMMAECRKLSTDKDDVTRNTAKLLRQQVLAAFAYKADMEKLAGTYVYPPRGGRVM